MFRKKNNHIITVARAVGSIEQITMQMQAHDPNEFAGLVQAAEDAIQIQADRFQAQLKAAEVAMEKERTDKEAVQQSNKKGK